jgi:hypothetical protein
MEAKDTSPTYTAFVDRYGITDAYELEAMEPSDLAVSLTAAIDEVIDIDAFNGEVAKEQADSQQIVGVKKQAREFFKSLKLLDVKFEERD